MDKISAVTQCNPVALARDLGLRLRGIRLAAGWTREELAELSGVAVSTLKLIESKGQGSFQRIIRMAVALGVDGELRTLFASPPPATTIESLKRAERQRAPRRPRKSQSILHPTQGQCPIG